MSPDLDSFLSLVQSLYRVVETPGTAESRGHHVDSQEGRQEEEGKEGTLLFHFNLVCIHFISSLFVLFKLAGWSKRAHIASGSQWVSKDMSAVSLFVSTIEDNQR